MRPSRLLFLGATLTLCVSAMAQETDTRLAARQHAIDTNAQSTLSDLFAEHPEAKELYDKATGYAVFTATKAGFVITGGGGTGVAVDKATGKRTYMHMGSGGIGLGIGAQRYYLVILFADSAHFNRFLEGGWDASTTAQAAAGTDGVTFTSSFVNGVASFQLTDKGLMAQADVSGTKFWVADTLNQNLN